MDLNALFDFLQVERYNTLPIIFTFLTSIILSSLFFGIIYKDKIDEGKTKSSDLPKQLYNIFFSWSFLKSKKEAPKYTIIKIILLKIAYIGIVILIPVLAFISYLFIGIPENIFPAYNMILLIGFIVLFIGMFIVNYTKLFSEEEE
jgi:hypothetical protein